MGIKVRYRKGEDKNTLFDWYDSFRGVGYKRFYGIASDLSASDVYSISTESVYSSYTLAAKQGSQDIDFDLTMATPMTIGGTAHIGVTLTLYMASGAASNIKAEVFHVNGAGAETSLGTKTSVSIAAPGSDGVHYRLLIDIDLTQKHFAVGEKLRINMISTVGGGWGIMWIDGGSFSVSDAAGRTVPTALIFDIPIKTDK